MNFISIINALETKNIYIFGTSAVYDKYKDVVLNYNVQGFLDNNAKMWEKQKDQFIIYNPNEVSYSNQTFVIIMSSYIEEISRQLEQFGLKNGEHFCSYIDLDNGLNLHRLIETGHFYSPVPNTNEIFSDDYVSYPKSNEFKGIQLNLETQEEFAKKACSNEKLFETFLNQEDNLFHINNNRFEYTDSITYFTFIEHFKPKKIIEVGSGFSSVLAMETSKFFNFDVDFTFIEPYPETLEKLLPAQAYESKLIKEKVQQVPLDFFTKLDEDDFLFIDSSHVSKVGSDVNYLLFEVLPGLKKGTIIHLHDIFADFEYPKAWVYKGRYWNESYLLRAFLQYNNHFEILCFNNFIFSENQILNHSLVNNDFGGSIWLRKLG